MIRLLLRLLKITDFEPCKSCEILKQQLEFERSSSRELRETLLKIVNPKVIVPESTTEVQPIRDSALSFSRRRAALEQRDRLEAQTLADSKHIGKPDNKIKFAEVPKKEEIEKLEEELGIPENKEEGERIEHG